MNSAPLLSQSMPSSAGRMFRTRTASTKLTNSEFREIEAYALRRGQSVSEWIRQTLLSAVRDDGMERQLFTELVGLELFLMDTLAPLARGERLSTEQYQAIVKQVQTTKAKRAQELLAMRAAEQER